jgi:predicted DCC family thiol-disulfide oxidoreductase YuxK
MAGLLLSYNSTGGTEALFIATYFLLLFGLFSDQDHLSVDTARRATSTSAADLSRFLRSDEEPVYRTSALSLSLLVLGILYFGAGLNKVLVNPGLSWTASDSLARYVAFYGYADHTYRPVADFLLSNPIVLAASTWGTLVLELGLLVGALAGLPIAPFAVGLIGMHTVIALSIGPFFFDYVVFLCLFGAYDSAVSWFARDRFIDVIYDSRCHRCMRILSLFKTLDTDQRLSFRPYSDALWELRHRADFDPEESVTVLVGDEVHGGHDAFRELLAQYRLLSSLAFATRVRSIELVGERLYRYIAADERTRSDRDATSED